MNGIAEVRNRTVSAVRFVVFACFGLFLQVMAREEALAGYIGAGTFFLGVWPVFYRGLAVLTDTAKLWVIIICLVLCVVLVATSVRPMSTEVVARFLRTAFACFVWGALTLWVFGFTGKSRRLNLGLSGVLAAALALLVSELWTGVLAPSLERTDCFAAQFGFLAATAAHYGFDMDRW